MLNSLCESRGGEGTEMTGEGTGGVCCEGMEGWGAGGERRGEARGGEGRGGGGEVVGWGWGEAGYIKAGQHQHQPAYVSMRISLPRRSACASACLLVPAGMHGCSRVQQPSVNCWQQAGPWQLLACSRELDTTESCGRSTSTPRALAASSISRAG